MQRLNNKTCVVTGAARGIGRAIAARFHDEDAIVIATDIDETAGAAATEIGCRFEPFDVRAEADWSRLAGVVPAADVVVNNAGVTGFEAGMVPHDPEHASLSDWREVHRVNPDGTFLGCRYAIGAMKGVGPARSSTYRRVRGWSAFRARRPMLRPRRRSATTPRRSRSAAHSKARRSGCWASTGRSMRGC